MSSWLSRWFDLDKVEAEADALAALFNRYAPGERWRNPKLVDSIFADMLGHAKGEMRKQRWGRLKVAILANKLLWKLQSHGYPQDFCKDLSTRLSIALAQDDAPPPDAPSKE